MCWGLSILLQLWTNLERSEIAKFRQYHKIVSKQCFLVTICMNSSSHHAIIMEFILLVLIAASITKDSHMLPKYRGKWMFEIFYERKYRKTSRVARGSRLFTIDPWSLSPRLRFALKVSTFTLTKQCTMNMYAIYVQYK